MPDVEPRERGSGGGNLGRKSLVLVSANWVANALGFLSAVLVARRLGAEAVGALGYGFGVIGIVAAALLPGFAQAHTKRVAEGHDLSRCLATMGWIQLVLQASMVAIVVGAWLWWPELIPRGVPVLVVLFLLLAQVLSNVGAAFSGALIGLQAAVAFASILLVGKSVRFVATALVLLWMPDVRWIAAAYALESAVELALAVWATCVVRGARPGWPDRATLRMYWVYARPLLVTSPIGLLQDSLDRVLVARWAGLSAAGYYQVARGLWEVLGTLNAYPFQLLFARLSQLFARRSPEGDREARRLFESAVDKLLFIAVPVAFTLWAGRDLVIGVLYGRAFLPAEGPLMVFVVAAVAQAAINPYHFIVYALEKHARFVPVVILRLVVYVIAMAVTVPIWDGVAAASVRLLLVLFPAWVYVRWTRELAGVGFQRCTWVYAVGFVLLIGINEAVRAVVPAGEAWRPLGLAVGALGALGAYAVWLLVAYPEARRNVRYSWEMLRPGRLGGL